MAAPEGILEKKTKQTPCKNNWERKHFLPAKLYLLYDSMVKTLEESERCSKLTITTPEGHHEGHYRVFIINFDHIS